jgi:hypothetical protein
MSFELNKLRTALNEYIEDASQNTFLAAELQVDKIFDHRDTELQEKVNSILSDLSIEELKNIEDLVFQATSRCCNCKTLVIETHTDKPTYLFEMLQRIGCLSNKLLKISNVLCDRKAELQAHAHVSRIQAIKQQTYNELLQKSRETKLALEAIHTESDAKTAAIQEETKLTKDQIEGDYEKKMKEMDDKREAIKAKQKAERAKNQAAHEVKMKKIKEERAANKKAFEERMEVLSGKNSPSVQLPAENNEQGKFTLKSIFLSLFSWFTNKNHE